MTATCAVRHEYVNGFLTLGGHFLFMKMYYNIRIK